MDEPGKKATAPRRHAIPAPATGPTPRPSSPDANPASSGVLQEHVTPDQVLQWWQAAGWRTITLDKSNLQAIANHCNRTLLDQQRKKFTHSKYGHKIDEVRRQVQRARHHHAGLKGALAALTDEMDSWTEEEQYLGGRVALQAYLTIIDDAWGPVAPVLTPARRSGGQMVPWAPFVSKLDDHLQSLLPMVPGTKATPESPLVAFIVSAVEAVFTALDKKVEDLCQAVAKLLVRQRAAKQK